MDAKKFMKILLVDDHALVREGVKFVLERYNAATDVLEANDCAVALDLAAQHPDIDLVLLDLSLPGMTGFEGLCCLQERLPNIPIVVLSASEDPAHIRQALARGARGYIPKTCTNEVMLSALQVVLSGGEYVPRAALGLTSVDNGASLGPRAELANQAAGHGLTQRQIGVLKLVIQGKTNKEIARQLAIAETTVRAHVTAIFKALNVTNRTQAGYVATRLGLWPSENANA